MVGLDSWGSGGGGGRLGRCRFVKSLMCGCDFSLDRHVLLLLLLLLLMVIPWEVRIDVQMELLLDGEVFHL